ncbi:MAG: cell division protein FtsZ [Azoarcus sp.]|jgi:cell division protein FtsZ|nr:cell division protein FtsZ [Azoarcus sp.]
MIELVEKEQVKNAIVIKVIGVGGAGGNAVDHMINVGLKGVEFVAANTDAQALTRCLAPVKLQLGSTGLGAGSKPEAGREAALDSRDAIAAVLSNTNMCFITGGMGGGTGTGAAPVVAEIAKEMGVLCVAVVVRPFEHENRDRVADSGIEELTRYVDALIVILNEKLFEIYGDDGLADECYQAADNVLVSAVGGISEIINGSGHHNVDFQDVRTAMAEMGRAMLGSAEASGIDRARIAAEQAAVSPLLEGSELAGARCALVNITASRSTLKLSEIKVAVSTVRAFAAPEAFVKHGIVYDESMGDRIRVTVVATGLGVPRSARPMMQVVQSTGTHGADLQGLNLDDVNIPSVIRRRDRDNRRTVEAMSRNGMDPQSIPAFLRRQAD